MSSFPVKLDFSLSALYAADRKYRRYFISIFSAAELFWRNFFFKLPTLAADCVGCYWLTKMFSDKRNYVAILYFVSPIVLYASLYAWTVGFDSNGAFYCLRQWGVKIIGFFVLLALSRWAT